MRLRLTRKFAARIDGIDLSRCEPGDVIALSADEAAILLAEGWAEAAPPEQRSGLPEEGSTVFSLRRKRDPEISG